MKLRRMNFGTTMAIAAAVAFSGATLRADDALPKAETILDHYVEVTGGKAAYEKRKTEIQTGTVEMAAQGLKGTMTRYAADPDKSYSVVEFDAIGKMEQGSVGGVAWEKSAMQGAHVKSGAEKADAIREGTFNSSLNWRKLYPKVETAGVETVGGEECYKVVMTPAEGKPETTYYSKKTGLAMKSQTIISSQMGELPVEVTVSDYKDFGGVLMPSKMVQKVMGQEMTMTVTAVKVNEAISPDKFELPADIKALAAKGAAK